MNLTTTEDTGSAGVTLADRLVEHPAPWRAETVQALVEDVLRELVALADAGRRHGALCPSMVVVSAAGRFALAPVPGRDSLVFTTGEARRYAPLEDETIILDLFALGAIAFELASGAHPFRDSAALVRWFLEKRAPEPPAGLSIELANLLAAMLHPDPARRPPGPQAALELLTPVPPARPTSPPVLPAETTSEARDSFLKEPLYPPPGTLVAGFCVQHGGPDLPGHGCLFSATDELAGGAPVILRLVRLDMMEYAQGGSTEQWLDHRRRLAAVRGPHLLGLLDSGRVRFAGPVAELGWEAWEELPGRRSPQVARGALPGAVPPCDDLGALLRFAADVVRGLAVLHVAGLVHGGVCPRAALQDTDGRWLLTPPPVLRPPGSRAGAPEIYFASPERFRDQPLIPQSDFFSLGCTLHAILDGGTGFEAVEVFECIMAERLDGRLVWRRARVPGPVRELVAWLIAPDPRQRPESAQRLLEKLDEVAAVVATCPPLGQVPPTPRWLSPQERIARRRSPFRRIVAAIARGLGLS